MDIQSLRTKLRGQLLTPDKTSLTAKNGDGSMQIKFNGYLVYLQDNDNPGSKDGFLSIKSINSFDINGVNLMIDTNVCHLTVCGVDQEDTVCMMKLVLPNGKHCMTVTNKGGKFSTNMSHKSIIFYHFDTPVVELILKAFSLSEVEHKPEVIIDTE